MVPVCAEGHEGLGDDGIGIVKLARIRVFVVRAGRKAIKKIGIHAWGVVDVGAVAVVDDGIQRLFQIAFLRDVDFCLVILEAIDQNFAQFIIIQRAFALVFARHIDVIWEPSLFLRRTNAV